MKSSAAIIFLSDFFKPEILLENSFIFNTELNM